MKIYLFQGKAEPKAPKMGVGEGVESAAQTGDAIEGKASIETMDKAASESASCADSTAADAISIAANAADSVAYELPEIFAKLKDGSLHLQDLARREGETQWRPLGEVMQKGAFTLFSATEIDRRQEEAPPAPMVVPDFQPIRTTEPTDRPAKKKGKTTEPDRSLRPFFAFLLLVLVGSFAFSWLKEIWALDAEKSTPTPRSRAPKQAAHHAVPTEAQPSPSVEESAVAENPPETESPTKVPPAIVELENVESTASNDATTLSVPPDNAVMFPEPAPPEQKTTSSAEPQNASFTLSQEILPSAQPAQDAASPGELQTIPLTLSQNIVPTLSLPAPDDADGLCSELANMVSRLVHALRENEEPAAEPPPPTGQLASGSMDFFKIEAVQFLKKEPKSKQGLWTKEDSKKKLPPQFIPCIEARVSTVENTRSDQTYARAHFFDERNRLIATLEKPTPAGGPSGPRFDMPVLFRKGKPVSLFFAIPEEAKNWKVVVVFGDKYQARASCYPTSLSENSLRYPEQALVHHPVQRVARKPAMDPLLTHEVKTKSARQPKITLFLRPPKGISQAEEIKGVLALCILAGSIEEIRRELQKEELSGDYKGLLNFANTHKLAILAWGSIGHWQPQANHDDLPKDKAQAIKEALDVVADAWEKGVTELSDKYGIPQKDYLLWGECGSAQWAHRLCLRKPDRFLAIAIHNSGSFDKPTPEAAKVLWCVTTGELYGGYERSLRFLETCQKMGYPITYKALVGVGHSGHPVVTELNFKFFEYAMAQQERRAQYEQMLAEEAKSTSWNKRPKTNEPWIETFRNPPYYGDIVNQETYSPEQKTQIPDGFQIPLPSKEIAETWAKNR